MKKITLRFLSCRVVIVIFQIHIEKLLQAGKKVILFATSGKVSRELNQLRSQGLLVFEIKKIRDFICWKKEIQFKAKGIPERTP